MWVGSAKCADFQRQYLRSIIGRDGVRCWSTQTGATWCQMSAISPLSLSALSTCTSTHARPPTLTPSVPLGKPELFAFVARRAPPNTSPLLFICYYARIAWYRTKREKKKKQTHTDKSSLPCMPAFCFLFLATTTCVLVDRTPDFSLVVAPPFLSIDQHPSREKLFVTTDFSSRPTIPSGCALLPAPLATPSPSSPLTAASEGLSVVLMRISMFVLFICVPP